VTTESMRSGRQASATRRRQRILKAITDAANAGEEITVSAIARQAGVDRSCLYRHRDLLAQIHAVQAAPPAASGKGPVVSHQSLRADLANADGRNARLLARNRQLERRLSELLGEQAWRESGLGSPLDVDQLQRRVVELEQHTIALQGELAERTEELHAARAANRELMIRLNAHH
jgi:chromosome segregation ATPase